MSKLYQQFHINKISVYILSAVIFFAATLPKIGSASEQQAEDSKTKVLILDNRDLDNDMKTVPAGDAIYCLNSKSQFIKKIVRLKINVTPGGHKAISISDDGSFFILCENEENRMIAYDCATHEALWQLLGIFNSTLIVNDTIYAINKENVYAIDRNGTIIKHLRFGGHDIAIDRNNKCLWIVGWGIKKLSFDLEVLVDADQIHAGYAANSVVVCNDGSIWMAAWDNLYKISPEGTVLQTEELDFFPNCACIDRTDDSIWVTGIGIQNNADPDQNWEQWPETIDQLRELAESRHTYKYDLQGNFLFEIKHGGSSIATDYSDGSVWIAGKSKIFHYSKTGEYIDGYDDVSENEKYIVIIQ